MIAQFTEAQESRLDSIVAQIDAIAQWSEEYNSENTDSPTADFCTWGWKEGDRDELATRALDDDWAPETAALCSALLAKGLSKEQVSDLLADAAGEPVFCPGIHRTTGAILSIPVGEIEEQIDEAELVAEVYSLDETERAYTERRINCSLQTSKYTDDCFYIYTSVDGYWSLVVESDIFGDLLVDVGALTPDEVDTVTEA